MKKDNKAIIVVVSLLLAIFLVIGLLFYEVYSLVKDVNIDTSGFKIEIPDLSNLFKDEEEEYFEQVLPEICGDASRSIDGVSYKINANFQYMDIKQGDTVIHHYYFKDSDGLDTGTEMDVGLYHEKDVEETLMMGDDCKLEQYQDIMNHYYFNENTGYRNNDRDFYIVSTDPYEKDNINYVRVLVMYPYTYDDVIYFDIIYPSDDYDNYFDFENEDYFYDLIDSVEVK